MKIRLVAVFFVFIFVSFVLTNNVLAVEEQNIDSDNDGILDYDEINVYYTDPYSKDTDGDGYTDWEELNTGYSPHNPERVLLKDNDQDGDGLSDYWELRFKTNLLIADTDGDGYSDGEEINNAYDPLSKEIMRLNKRIEINLAEQELYYFLDGVRLNTYLVSSGAYDTTPRGHYDIINKHPKAWSPYGLWMPYWMGMGTGKFGLHELPIWPSGYREGEDHLGTAVSHGCIRLGIGPAETLYNWTEVGTPVYIY
ncbi:MAG TPA: L,D-transpeptidase family protein [Patescibacteria group bacterium]|nr:L,D-transpeptidase family protein [Patescibacteria group bacterium]